MRRLFPALLTLALTCGGLTMARPARAAPQVELLTFHSGEDVWSRFGHTALRVRDERRGTDIVYSFGYAPFTQPSFIWEFLRGDALFGVGVRTFGGTVLKYKRDRRTMERQPLDIGAFAAIKLDHSLRRIMLPGNNHYRYDQLRDNCATRVRDLIDEAAGGALKRASTADAGHTYRDDTASATAGSWLLSFVLDIIGGPNQDQPVSGWGELYLPAHLQAAVARTTVTGRSGERPLAPETILSFRRDGPEPNEGLRFTGRWGWLGFAALVALGLVFANRRSGLRRPAATLLLGFGLWTSGWALLLFSLVCVSRVADFSWNENVLAWPITDVVLLVCAARLWRGRPPLGPWLVRYAQFRVGWAALLVLGTLAGVLPQDNVVFTLAPALVFAALWRSHVAQGSSATATP